MKIRILIIALLSSILISCENYFDLERNRPDLPEWQSVNDLSGTLNTCYKTLLTTGGWGNVVSNVLNYTEVVSDLTIMNPGGSWSFGVAPAARSEYPFDMGTQQLAKIFPKIYISISCSNTLISFIKEVESGNIMSMSALSSEELTKLAQVKGEAYFMRGFSYYLLSQLYMPPYSVENKDVLYIPYITERYYTSDELLAPPMGTMEMVYDLMLSDFTVAKSEMVKAGMSDNDIQNSHRGYANKYAASAMLMRLNFIQRNWSAALTECEFIEKGPYDLSEQPIRAFNRNIESAVPVANEVILDALLVSSGGNANAQPPICRLTKIGNISYAVNKQKDFSDPNWLMGGRESNWLHTSMAAMYWNPSTLHSIGWAEANTSAPSDNLRFQLTAEAKTDLRCTQLNYYLKRFEEGGDPSECEMQYTATTWDAMWCDKYLRAPNASYSQLPIIRFAEVLLTKASCLVQSNGSNTEALAAINIVRERAFGNSSHNLAGTITEAMIETERIKELSFEGGDRLLYLAAMKRDLPNVGKKTDPAGVTDDVPAIPYPYNGFHIQIPYSETDFSSTADKVTNNY